MPERGNIVRAVCLALAVLCAACTGPGSSGPPDQARAAGPVRSEITVGSFDFPESVLLGHIYADALAAKGFPARVLPDLGTRELVDPALMNGLIQIVPEYARSALAFMSLGHLPGTSDTTATYRSLTRSAERRGLVAAKPAPAQDNNAIVVTRATAARYHLRSIADVAKVAPDLVFGGPPECPERAYCLPGLERTYGLRFKAFAPTDAGGPLTLQALVSGQIGARPALYHRPGRRRAASGHPGRQPDPAAGREHHPAGQPEHRRRGTGRGCSPRSMRFRPAFPRGRCVTSTRGWSYSDRPPAALPTAGCMRRR